jgi:hypothetical protein
MTGFRFRLERVLHWRAVELASEEARLKRLIEEEARLKSELDAIHNIISELPRRIAALDDITGSDLTSMASYRRQLEIERDRTIALLREKKEAIARQAEVHRQAKQRHHLLAELRSRRHVEWKMQMLRQLDELAHDSYLARWSTL